MIQPYLTLTYPDWESAGPVADHRIHRIRRCVLVRRDRLELPITVTWIDRTCFPRYLSGKLGTIYGIQTF